MERERSEQVRLDLWAQQIWFRIYLDGYRVEERLFGMSSDDHDYRMVTNGLNSIWRQISTFEVFAKPFDITGLCIEYGREEMILGTCYLSSSYNILNSDLSSQYNIK